MKPSVLIALLLAGCLLQNHASAVETQNIASVHAEQGESHAPHGNHEDDADHHHDEENDHDDHGQGAAAHKEADHNEDDGHDHGDEHGHSEELSTRIHDTMASQVGIKSVSAGSKVLRQSIVAYGSLTAGPEQLSHVRARYSGLIKSVKPTIGDIIKRGDLLAEVESNESLKTYQLLAPIDGTVIQRHANTGEVTQDQVLFSIANFDTLWAEFRIYPSQQALVKAGQPAHITVDKWEFGGPIQHIIPALDKPYQLARVKFDNRSKGLTLGLLVEGHIIVGELKVDLAVEKNAIQTLGEQQGVFVKNGDEYEFTPLRLDRSDDQYAEVLSGLSADQQYVNENSYLIKADIEKSEAEHEH